MHNKQRYALIILLLGIAVTFTMFTLYRVDLILTNGAAVFGADGVCLLSAIVLCVCEVLAALVLMGKLKIGED